MARTHEQFLLEMEKLHPHISVIGIYTKAVNRVKVKCEICGKIWSPKAYSLLQGKRCPHCSAVEGAKKNRGKTGLKSNSTFRNQLNEVDNSINVIGDYVNTHTCIKCKCKRCGHEWEAKPYSLLQGHGCPRCTKSGTSFMEQLILNCFIEVLGEDKVRSRDKKMIGMELDIFIPNLSFAIEPGNWNLHKNSIERDRKKGINVEKKIFVSLLYMINIRKGMNLLFLTIVTFIMMI